MLEAGKRIGRVYRSWYQLIHNELLLYGTQYSSFYVCHMEDKTIYGERDGQNDEESYRNSVSSLVGEKIRKA